MKKVDEIKLFSIVRRKDLAGIKRSPLNAAGSRTEIERDFDRILFSAPVRRLADKTQVFPLERNDSVRNRLTHSYEVSNLARSIGTALVYSEGLFTKVPSFNRDIPSMLAAVGLAHDLGNPPFGHQGEAAIGSWFKKNEKIVFGGDADITEPMKKDYFQFEGNAQTFRLLTKLQILNDNFGLNLTCGSLAALMKYPTTSDNVNKGNIATKKFGVFQSELAIAEEVWKSTGLVAGIRHPLAFIMEASDDIAYSVLDVEDSIKKGLFSYRDLIDFLMDKGGEDKIIKQVVDKSEKQHKKHKEHNLSPHELAEISTQMFRVFAIGGLATSTTKAFKDSYESILKGDLSEELLSVSEGSKLCELLKEFAFQNSYKHRSVLEVELIGYRTIHSLMDMMWKAIVNRGDPVESKGHKGAPFEQYVYSRISENYKRIFEDKKNNLPLSYKRAQLLGDMLAGMTDSFAMSFDEQLKALRP